MVCSRFDQGNPRLAVCIIEDAVENYFSDKRDGVRFYVESKFKLISKTVAEYMKRKSRIDF